MKIQNFTLKSLLLVLMMTMTSSLFSQVAVRMTWTAGAFADEPGWELFNTATPTVVIYCKAAGAAAPAPITVLNLPPGTYGMRGYDQFGDGWNNGTVAFSIDACNLPLATFTGPANVGFAPGNNACPGPSPVNGTSSSTLPQTFTVVAPSPTCVLSVPASTTVNADPLLCGTSVVLPIATSSGCPNTSLQPVLAESFTAGIQPAGWTVSAISGSPTGGGAAFTLPAGYVTFGATGTATKGGAPTNAAFAGNHMRFDDDGFAGVANVSSTVTTNVIAIPAASTGIALKFDYAVNFISPAEVATAQYNLNGSGVWTTIPGMPTAPNDVAGSINLALPNGTTSVQVRFIYYDANGWQWSYDIDNLLVQALVNAPSPITNSFNTGGPNASGLFPVGTTVVTFSSASIPGTCPVTATTNVTVVDVTPPVVTNCPTNITVSLGAGECTKTVNWTAPTFSDACIPNPPVPLVSNGGGVAGLINTNIGQAALFYDIKNTNNFPITLTSVDVLKRVAATATIFRTTTATTYVGNETLAASWTQIGTGALAAGIGTSNVPVTANSLNLLPGQSVGICIVAVPPVAGGPQIVGAVNVAANTTYAGPQRRVLAGVEFTYGVVTNFAGGAAFSALNGNFGQIAGFPSTSYSAFMGNMNFTSLPVPVVQTSTPLNGTVPFKIGDPFVAGTTTIKYTGTDGAGNASMCQFNIIVQPSATLTKTLTCQDQVNISMTPTCTAIINAEKILNGGPYGCLGSYTTQVFNGTNQLGQTNYNAATNTYTYVGTPLCNFVGKTLTAKVFDVVNPNNFCWGNVLLEDKLAPVITCPANLTLDDCSTDIATATNVKTAVPINSTNAAMAFVNANTDVPVVAANFPATSVVEEIKVRAKFTTGDWVSNVSVELVTPTGVVIPLKTAAATGTCNSSSAVVLGAATTNFDYLYDAAAVNGPITAATPCASLATWNTGAVRPASPFTPALGLPVNGTWLVRFRDADGVGPNNIPAIAATIEFTTTIPIMGATAVDGCGFTGTTCNGGPAPVVFTDQIANLPCSNPFLRQIKRTYKATDNSGNTALCTQLINFRRPTLATIKFPADVNLDCTYDNLKADPNNAAAKDLIPAILGLPGTFAGPWFDADGNPSVSVTGRPTPSGGSCSGIVVDYQDMRLNNVCAPGVGYTIMRTWKVYDACANALTTKAQQITVKDVTAPVIAPITPIVASTGASSCKATIAFARPAMSDNCASAAQLTYFTEIFANGNGSVTAPTLGAPVGLPTNNPNEYTDLDISPTVIVSGLPRPLPYVVRFTATDACGNTAVTTALLSVMDITAPVAICPPTMKVSLSQDGSALITALEIDRGSYDNCTGIAKMEVRRMGNVNNCTGKDTNNDGDYDDYLLQANSNVSFELPDVYYSVEEKFPFTGVYPAVLSPYVALAKLNFLQVTDNFTNGILDRTISQNPAWLAIPPAAYPFQPDVVAYPTLWVTGPNTVIFNNFSFTLTFNGAGVLLTVTPNQVFLPAFSLTKPFQTRDLLVKGSTSTDPDPADVYGDYNLNGDPTDEDYYEHNYYNFYHPEVKVCCEDAGDTIMIAMRIWDASIYKHATNNANPNHSYYRVGYPRTARVRGNVNICMIKVIVEDKIDPKIVTQDTTVFCGTNPTGKAWLDAHTPVQGAYNSTMSDQSLFSNNNAVSLAAGGNADIVIPVSGMKSVKDINVALKFYHTDLGNLTATVTSPSGKTAALFATPVDANGNPYTSTGISSSNSLFRLTFDDEPTLSAAAAIGFQSLTGVPNAITPSNLNLVNGSYLGNDPLSIFDGENPNGNWTISFVSSDPSSVGAGAIVAGGAQVWIKGDRINMPQGYFYDNCTGFCVTYVDNGQIDNCGKGKITRTWTIKDVGGRTATDQQDYVSVNRSAYKVEFPADVTIQCNNNKVYGTHPDQSGKPVVTPYAKTCPLVGIEFTDDTLVVAGLDNSCFKIIRKWKVLNWCQTLNLNPDAVQRRNLPACNPADLTPRTFINVDYAAWAGMTTAQVNAELGECTNTTYDEDGYMEYVQIIKVVDNTPPTITAGTVGLEAVGKECAVNVTVGAAKADDCTGKTSTTYEIINSSNVIVASGVSGVTKFGDGTTRPFGKYTVRYTASDNCGNFSSTDIAIDVKDAKKPTPICFYGLSVDLMPTTGNVMVNCNLFDAGSYDNCEIEGCYIQYPAPGAGADITKLTVDATANGMTDKTSPKKLAKNVLFECVGFQTVALWIKDKAGNWDYCETYIDVQNNMGAPNVPNCPKSGTSIVASAKTEAGKEVENVGVKLVDNSTANSKPIIKVTGTQGFVDFSIFDKNNSYVVTPELDKMPLNGVSTLDLVLISKHILGVQPLDNPYKLIAADVNKNGTVTTADIVELRKMILAVQSGFSKNTSWRFVDKSYTFPAINPLSVAFPESKQFTSVVNDKENADFVSVKIGDVNGNAGTNGQAVGRGAVGTFYFNVDEKSFNAGEEVRATFKAEELASVLGYQFTLGYDKSALDLINIEGANENFGVIEAGSITTSWNGQGEGLFTVVFKAKKTGSLSQSLNINSRYTNAEAYTKSAEMLNIAVKYNNSTAKMELYQNQPNPFAGRTVIGFNLTKAENARLTIYDATGRVLRTIEKDFAKGYNEVAIEDINASGVLKYTLSTASESATKSMIILE